MHRSNTLHQDMLTGLLVATGICIGFFSCEYLLSAEGFQESYVPGIPESAKLLKS